MNWSFGVLPWKIKISQSQKQLRRFLTPPLFPPAPSLFSPPFLQTFFLSLTPPHLPPKNHFLGGGGSGRVFKKGGVWARTGFFSKMSDWAEKGNPKNRVWNRAQKSGIWSGENLGAVQGFEGRAGIYEARKGWWSLERGGQAWRCPCPRLIQFTLRRDKSSLYFLHHFQTLGCGIHPRHC